MQVINTVFSLDGTQMKLHVSHCLKSGFVFERLSLPKIDAVGQRLYLGVVWWQGELSRPAAALVLQARVFVVGLFPLAGGGGPGLLAGGRCHLQHHHAAAGARG